MASLQDRLQAASEFLLQSPPAEVNDVFSDIRLLVSDDTALEAAIVPTLSLYNRSNYVAVTLEHDPSSSFLLTEGGRIVSSSTDQGEEEQEERYVCPSSQTSYTINHLRLTASDPRPFPIEQETQAIRDKVADLLAKFVKNHYHNSKSEVLVLEDENYPAPPVEEEEPAVEETKVAAQDTNVEEEQVKDDEEEGATKTGDGVAEGEAEPITTASASTQEDPAPASPIHVDDEQLTLAAAINEPTQQPAEPKRNALHPRTSRIFALYFVGNKYNPSNYWTGRWRSVYTVDLARQTVEAKAEINVHYYEQGPYSFPTSREKETPTNLPLPSRFLLEPGNVQLSTLLTSNLPLSTSTPTPESLIALIKSSETSFSSQLADSFESFSEEGFKGLRRALPKNKCKLDWEKVGHYKLGREMGGGTAEA